RPRGAGLPLPQPSAPRSPPRGRQAPPRTAGLGSSPLGLADLPEDVDPIALGQAHDRALGVGPLAVTGAGALALALPVDRVHPGDLDPEDLLHRDLDLRLVRGVPHQERVLVVLVDQAVALLGDHRLDDDVARVGDPLHGRLTRDRLTGVVHQASSFSVRAPADSRATTWS